MTRGPSARDAELAKRLRALPLFDSLGDADLVALASAGVRRRLRRRQRLYARGEAGDALVVVLSGTLEVTREGVAVRTLRPGALVGLSTIAGAVHSADVVAAEASEVLLLAGRAVRPLFARAPELPLAIIRALAALVVQLSDDVDAFRTEGLHERVKRKLAQLGAGRREIVVTHAQLAAMVGASRANTSRALEKLARTGAIRLRRGRIELP